ncbi:hypothetical protein BMW22_15590 [Rhizobium leguminosarum]|uniref:Peptidase S74 domain-containing protein n=1 Tax=Rhizobium leguminosarum TaxID=384 RepID=A0A1L3ZB62_RHILE|nr:tail fiber domain-containing protein [Rhizobium leguminosarum]API52847.1 hypothetical protein BMW22_15590 [Rhizobium leguminosarum]
MGGKSSTSTTKTELPPQIVKAYEGLIAQATPISQTPYQAYKGGVGGSGFEQNQLAGFDTIAGLKGGANGYFDSANSALNSSTAPTYSTVDNYMSPYLDNVVKSTMANMNEQNAEQQQGVLGNAAVQGALGGNRVGVAQAELARQQNLANQQTISGLYNQGYNTALGAAQSDKAAAQNAAAGYANLGNTAMQTNLQQAAAQVGAGTQQQQWDYQQYQNKLAYPFETTSWLANIVSGLGSGMGGTTTSKQPSGNTGSAVLGGLLSLGSMFSDKRLKEGVVPIGKTFDGQNIYRYRYKDEPVERIGLMAQEVEKHHPDAVGKSHGYKTVEYKAATDKAAERGHFAQGGIIPYTSPSGIMAANNNNPAGANDNGGYVPQAASAGLSPGRSTLPQAPSGGSHPDQGDQILQQGIKAQTDHLKEKYPNGILAGLNHPTPSASPAPAAVPAPTPAANPAGGGFMSALGNLFGFADGGVIKAYAPGGYVDPYLVAADPVPPGIAAFDAGNAPPPPAPVEFNPDRFASEPVATTPQGLQKGLVGQQLNEGILPPAQTAPADWNAFGPTEAAGTPNAAPALPPPVNVATKDYPVAGVVPQNDNAAAPEPAKGNKWTSTFNKINTDFGLPEGYLNRTAYLESRYNPNADNGIARGIFQFTDPTAGQYGLKNPFDALASADAAARLAQDNYRFLKNGLGRDPTGGELYLAHQQGASGALNLLTHPDAPATDIIGRAAVVQNGGKAGMSAGQFAGLWTNKFGGAPADASVGSTDTGSTGSVAAAPSSRGVIPPASNEEGSTSIGDLFNGKGFHMSNDQRMALLQAGLGMMAGTSPNFATNVGAGGLKGVESWRESQKLNREKALAESEIAATQGNLGLRGQEVDIAGRRLALEAQKNAADIGQTTANTANLELENQTKRYQQTITPAGIIIRDMTNPNAPPKLTTWADIQKNGVPPEATSNEAIGAGVASGNQQPQNAPQEPTKGARVPQSAPVTAAPTKPVAAPQEFVTKAPQSIPMDGRLFSPTGQDIAKSETIEGLKQARTEYQGAASAQTQLEEMKHDLAAIDDSAWTAPGTGFQSRVQWAKTINTAFQGLGVEAPIDTTAVAAGEDLNKLSTRLGFDLSKTLGSNEAATVVNQAVSAVPGGYNSPEGARRIIAGIEAANQRKLDYYTFLQDWTAKSGGSILGADEYFNRVNPPEKYANSALLSMAIAPKSQAEIDSAPKGTMFNINGQLMVK